MTPCLFRPVGACHTSWCSPSLAPRAHSPTDARRIGKMQLLKAILHPPKMIQHELKKLPSWSDFFSMPIHGPSLRSFPIRFPEPHSEKTLENI